MAKQEDIQQLQLMEQSLQQFLMQKQTFQAQLMEIESALSELSKTKQAYKIIGNIMIASSNEDLKKDLEQKKEILSLRVKNLEKQEEKLKESASKLQSEVLKEMKK
ncbi:prefoldin subunit beta [Nanoarchaeota archaeon]